MNSKSLKINPSELRHEAVIKAQGDVMDRLNHATNVWTDFKTVRCGYFVQSGVEKEGVSGQYAVGQYVFYMRYFEGLTESHRLYLGDEIFDIENVNNVEGRNIKYILRCKKAAREMGAGQ